MSIAIGENVGIWHRPALARFAERGADLAVLVRPPRFDLISRIASGSVAEYRSRVTSASASRQVRSALRCIGLSDDEALTDDAIEMTEGFLQHFDLASAHFRVEIVDRRMCPRFHQDNVHVRMLITYAGPGTEYVPAHDERDIHHAPREAVVLMKGAKNPTNAGAVLHRSPDLAPGQRRLCLVIDY